MTTTEGKVARLPQRRGFVQMAIFSLVLLCILAIVWLFLVKRDVVIEEQVTTHTGTVRAPVVSRTMMVRGDKEKLISDGEQSIVIDVDNGKVTIIDAQHKRFRELPFGAVMGTPIDPSRFLYLAFRDTGQTRRFLGFKCRDYRAAKYGGALMTAVNACFSTEAPGAATFTHFMHAVLRRLGPRAQAVSIPAGIPLIIETSQGINPSFTPLDVPEKEALAFKNRIAKIPPQVIRQEITKISSKKLRPDVFNVPAGYTRLGRVPG